MTFRLKFFIVILFFGVAFNDVKAIPEKDLPFCAAFGGLCGGVAGLAVTAGVDGTAVKLLGIGTGMTLGACLGYVLALDATPKRRMERGIGLKNYVISSTTLKRYFLIDIASINSLEFLRFVGGNRIGSRWPLIDEEKSLISCKNDLLAGRSLLELAYQEDATLESICSIHISEINYLIEKINAMVLILTSSPDYSHQMDRLQQYEIENAKLAEEKRKNGEKERAKEEELRLRSESNAIKRQGLVQTARPAQTIHADISCSSSVTTVPSSVDPLPLAVIVPSAISGQPLSLASVVPLVPVEEIKNQATLFSQEIIKDFAGANFGKIKKEDIIKYVVTQISKDIELLVQKRMFSIFQYQGSELKKKVKNLVLEYLHKNKLYPAEECSVCLEKFDNKRLKRIYLPCGHDVCNNCLKQLNPLECPLCRDGFSEEFKSLDMDVEYAEPLVYVEPTAPPAQVGIYPAI